MGIRISWGERTMKRRIYVICQKKNWKTGVPQVISDGAGQLEYVFASKEGLRRAKHRVEIMNKDKGLHQVHVRKATLIIEEEIK